MKQLLIISAIILSITTAKGQTTAGMSHGQWETNEKVHHKTPSGPVNDFVSTEMAYDNGIVTFTDLPAVKKTAYAVLTNAAGDFIKQTRITPQQNTMEIKKLHSGLYFITIVYRNESKKAFTLNL